MTDRPAPPARRYDEEEVARILKRATELHQEEPLPAGRSGGLSLEELEEIAREAGIDPRHLRRAAMEVEGLEGGEPVLTGFLGARPTLALETVVPGEIEGEAFERVVAVIHRHTPEHGQPSLLGRSLTWRAETSSKTRTLQVTVTSGDGDTEIRVEERLHQLAAGLFGGGMGGGGVGIGVGVGLPVALEVVGSAALAVALPLSVVTLAYVGARATFRTIVARRQRALARLMDAVVQEVRRSAETSPTALEAGAEAERLPPSGDPSGHGPAPGAPPAEAG